MKPKISLVTVSYNSANTISQTIESVLHQTLSPYEYTIVDGKSTDNTVAVAERYREAFSKKGISYTIISEPDNGLYDAMNKGIRLSSGNIVGMINSDDWYEPVAVQRVFEQYQKAPFDLFYADMMIHKKTGCMRKRSKKLGKYLTTRYWNHPTTFITKEMYGIYQYRNQCYYDDWDLVVRMVKDRRRISVLNEVLANFRFGGISSEKSFTATLNRIKTRYTVYRDNSCSRFYLLECMAVETMKYLLG